MLYSLFSKTQSSALRTCCMALLLVSLLGLSACGKKSGFVDAPAGSSASDFPRTYPDLSTDKKP